MPPYGSERLYRRYFLSQRLGILRACNMQTAGLSLENLIRESEPFFFFWEMSV